MNDTHGQNRSGRRLKVLLTPPEKWQAARDNYVLGNSPAEGRIDLLLAEQHGIDIELMDPGSFPLNPLANYHPVYQGLDVVRCAKVLSKKRDVDLVLSIFESSPTFLLLARRLLGFRPKIAIWDIAPDETWKTRKIIQDIVLPRIDHVFLLSSSQQAYAERRWNALHKTSVVWHHVDTEFYQPVRPNPIAGPVLAIGDDHGRDWDTFIQAVAPLDIEVIAKTKKQLTLPRNRNCRLTQISHRISYKELRNLYAQSSLVVIPLKNTLNVSGVGSLLESMAMGKAIVISDNPPIRDYLVPDKMCRVIPVGDSASMQSAIIDLLHNPTLLNEYGRVARERAISLYSEEAFASRLSEQIRDVIAE